MKLSSFSVENYRSITTARKISTNNMTVLVGKNNEGKSNILRALSLAMSIMKSYSSNQRVLSRTNGYWGNGYSWERDYPISIQEAHPNGASLIELDFELSEKEIGDIRQLTGIRLNSNIPVRISINQNITKVDIPKKGTTAFSDSGKKKVIIEYICGKIDFIFIPAIRTEENSLRVIEKFIDDELSFLENNPEYISAINTIDMLQRNVLSNISTRIKPAMQEFLPAVQNVRIVIKDEQRRIALRKYVEVIIDDGTATPIQQKGDGIKSLTALAMLNMINRTDRVSVIAIEEPESHLHPESSRQLYETIKSLSLNHQVVLTTHSPLFVNRTNLSENIIVNAGKATPAKKIKEIRDILGIKVSDNLTNAENVLLVEGEDDKIVLEKLLPNMSDLIKKSLQNGILIIDYIGGAGNLSYKLSLYRNLQFKCHVLLDNDDAGRNAGVEAERQDLLEIRNTTYTNCNGSPNAEIEDCYEKRAYKSAIWEEFGVNIDVSEFRNNNKWSDRMKQCFKSQGKQWNDMIEKRVKLSVANVLPENPAEALNQHKRTSIDALVTALETMIQQNQGEDL